MYDQYAYDELGQLIREDNKDANKSYTYTYDSRGNLLSKKTYAFTLGTLGTAQKTDSYGYATDSWKDRLTSYNGQTITYDSIGNPLTYNNGSAYTFTWEGRQMQSATKDLKTWTYTYNSDGLRTGKTNGSTTYSYKWNENGQLSSMVCGTSSAWFYYDHEGKPLYMEYADGNDECSGTYRYILNLQGDVVGLYDLTRDCMAMTYTYDAWGRELSWSTLNSGYAGLLYGNPLTYRGYIYDRETGFYYLQSRYYDPTVGRFLNADDVRYLGIGSVSSGWNLYAYCYNSPTNYSDPSGNIAAVDDVFFGLFSIVVAALALLTPKQLPTQGNTVVLPQPGSSTLLPLPIVPYSSFKIKKQYIAKTGEVVDLPQRLFPPKEYSYWIAEIVNKKVIPIQGLTYSQAFEWAINGGNLLCVDQGAAYAIAKFFPSHILEKTNKCGYLWHYHLNNNHENHIWFYGEPIYLYR